MRWIDPKFKEHKKNFFFQTLIAGLFAFAVLIALGGYEHAEILGIIGFTSLGSSAFITFGTHDLVTSSTRCMLGGYVVSIAIGVLCWYLCHLLLDWQPWLINYFVAEICAAISITIAMFLMVVFDLEHPPAAGLALGLTVQNWSFETLLIIIIAVALLIIVKMLLRKRLMSLL